MQNTRRDTRASDSLIALDSTDNNRHAPVGYCGRFAPSPTGPLHFGSLVAALASFLQAKAHGTAGTWLLRIDDIDPPREVAGSTNSIVNAMMKHGFVPDGTIQFQSQHSARYEHALSTLGKLSLIYGCNCSRKQQRRSTTNSQETESNTANVYPGTCRQRQLVLTDHAIRFIVDQEVTFTDQVMGSIRQFLPDSVGDFVLKRKDSLYAYQLASVVDDGVDGITEVVRGADLLDNTPRQIALATALGYTLPEYLHVPVAVNDQGQKLSKQTMAMALNQQHPIDNLRSAWRFLGQAPLCSFSTPANLCRVDDFWSQAFDQWDTDRIPRNPTQRVSSEFQ